MRKAKIVCTIGPASCTPSVLERLINGGMDAARLNFSHGTHEDHAAAIRAIRQAAEQCRSPVAVIQDLQGPRIRVGDVANGSITVAAGETVWLVPAPEEPAADDQCPRIPITYRDAAREWHPGSRILIDDGLIELKVTAIAAPCVACAVVTGGVIASHKGINVPGTPLGTPSVTDKDEADVRFGITQDIDYLALSFVRGREDVAAAKRLVAECGGDVPIIAKIERADAVAHLEEILDEAAGVMIARGDLGVEMGPEAVPLLQKRIIAQANRRRRLVITATQMLESMTHQRRPTRAEASDVANAVFDGTDAVMLSAETAVGRHPVETVEVMDRIIRAAEDGSQRGVVERRQVDGGDLSLPEAICTAASSAATAIRATAIVAFSELGRTALLISKQRPPAPIIAFTPFETVRRRMALYWGVRPQTMQQIAQTDERIDEAERRLKTDGFVKPGERIVILSGTRIGQPGGTNLVKLQEIR